MVRINNLRGDIKKYAGQRVEGRYDLTIGCEERVKYLIANHRYICPEGPVCI